MSLTSKSEGARPSRRQFIKTSAAAAGGLAAAWSKLPAVHAAGSDMIRIGLIGCGDRGTGAVDNAFEAAPGVQLVAMGDVFEDRLEESLAFLSKKSPDKVDVPEARRFIGFDAVEKVLASDANYIILTTPPGFRSTHLKAAVAAGKNIFSEKPVAVDGPGIRTVLEAYDEANRKGLAIGVGTQRRHQTGYLETMKRLQDGAIGRIVGGRVYWNQGSIWVHPRQADWTDMQYQLRNWYYFTWICGDHIVEQHVHNLDVANWALGTHPASAVGLGGRQVRTGPDYGNIYDHFAINYEYEGGVHIASYCRQIPDCQNDVSEAFVGTKGFCQANRYMITGENSWKLPGKDNKPYVQEHTDLIAAIRAGKPYNELKQVAESTLTAILGRMAAYTGQLVTWEQALNSKEELLPPQLDWNAPLAVAPVAMPGTTQLV